MNTYCRKCGKRKYLYPMRKPHRDILAWFYPEKNFTSDKLVLCSRCMDHAKRHIKPCNTKKSGAPPKGNITISLWDDIQSCPIFGKDRKPLYTTISSNRNLNGTFRSNNAPMASNERKEPSLEINIQVQDNNPLIDAVINVSTHQQKNQPKRSNMEEREQELDHNIVSKEERGLKKIDTVDNRGRGIETTEPFDKGEYITTYHGELLEGDKGMVQHKKYSVQVGSFMFFFSLLGKKYCIDATDENNATYGRLINHKRKGNLIPKSKLINKIPYIYFVAKNNLLPGTELLYDYNDPEFPQNFLRY